MQVFHEDEEPATTTNEQSRCQPQPGFSADSFDLDREPARYRYELVAEHLTALIRSGQLQPNMPLPSEGDLARAYGVSLGTARHATRLLRLRGLVTTLRSKGTYVTADEQRRCASLDRALTGADHA